MAGQHGGKRLGAGRPKKDRTPATDEPIFESAEAYLEAVVAGKVTPDSVRVQAAKTLIAYQTAKQRAPKKALTPAQMAAKEARAVEDAVTSEFEKKAAEVDAGTQGGRMKVDIRPMPMSYRKLKRFRPMPPPIFPDGPPTEDDIELARELFKALDPESREWYRCGGSRLFDGL